MGSIFRIRIISFLCIAGIRRGLRKKMNKKDRRKERQRDKLGSIRDRMCATAKIALNPEIIAFQ